MRIENETVPAWSWAVLKHERQCEEPLEDCQVCALLDAAFHELMEIPR